MQHRVSRRRQGEHGAAAVEFALVVPIFLLIVFGILQYGLYFFDSNSLRQGVREAARMGVVENFSDASCTSGGNGQKLTCIANRQIGSVTADTTWIKVTAPSGWTRGKPLLVCAIVRSQGVVGLLPIPSGGWIHAETQMSIEKQVSGSSWADNTRSYPTNTALPSGQDWSWCG